MKFSKKGNYTLIISTLILFLTMTIIGVQVQRDKIVFEESKVKVTTSEEKIQKLKNYLSIEIDKLASSKTLSSIEFEIDKILASEKQDVNFSSSFEQEKVEMLIERLNLTLPIEIDFRIETREYIDRKVLFLVFKNLNINQTQKETKEEKDCLGPNDEIIEEGSSKKYYAESLTDVNKFCRSEIRICSDSTLSGKYTNDECFSSYEEAVIESLNLKGIIKYK